MKRRLLLGGLLAFALTLPLVRHGVAHTPYRQWKILRQRFLLVHSTRSDPVSDEIAGRIVEVFDRVLPQAKAMVARAPDEQRVASLMTTGQAVLAVMQADEAADLYLSRGAFGDYDGEQLRAVVAIDDHLLVSVASFPRHHAWLVTSALIENGAAPAVRLPDDANAGGEVPLHEGAAAFARGEPLEAQN
jgi:hypothetical protein